METISKQIRVSNKYNIEGKVHFDSSTGILYSLTDDKKFTLLAASSECFITLLESQGSLVSKNELIKQGWSKYGLHVTDNTFYQNILVLRKGLKYCGIEKEIVKTIPRKGLIIPLEVDIKLVNNELVLSEAHDCSEREKNDLKSNQITMCRNPSHTCSTTILSTLTNAQVIFLIATSLFILTSSIAYSLNEDDFFSMFTYTKVYNGCNYYMQVDKFNELKKISALNSFDCSNNESLYISIYKHIPRISIIECTPKKNGRLGLENCISYYYLERK